MKIKFYYILLFAIGLFLYSCKSAEKLYRNGQYEEAVAFAAKKLSKKPNDAATLDILQNAYRYAVEDHERTIRNLSNTSSDLKWERIYNQYQDLQRLYNSIRSYPAVFDIVQPTDYSAYITTYKEEAAIARVDRGNILLNNNDKQSAKEAYYEFQKALTLKPGDLSIKDKMNEAYSMAVTNVMIMPLTRYGYQYSSYYFDMNNFNNNVFRYLNNNRSNPFIRYYSSFGDNNQQVRVDNTVEMRFSDVNIGRYRDQRSVREVSKQIVGKEIVYSKDSVIKEYITVKAKITTTTRTLQADGLLQATIRDHNNRFLWSDTYRGDYNWVTTFSTFTGDERALSDEDKKLINRKEQWPPSNDEIIRIIMNEIQNKTECGINDYFNRQN
jgi:hypothetical protein